MSINIKSLSVWAKKYPVLLICGFLSITFSAFLYFRSGLIADQQVELDRLSDKSKRILDNVGNSSQLQEQLDFLIQANKAIKLRSLNPDGLAENLQYFYRLESELGLKYRDLRPSARSAPNKQSVYIPINYTIALDGSFSQVISFIKHLEQGAYFCRITSAAVDSSNSKTSITLNFDILGIK